MRRQTQYISPSETRWSKTNIIFTIVAAVATVASVIYAIWGPKPPTVGSINFNQPEKTKASLRVSPRTIPAPAKLVILPVITVKKNINDLRIIYAGTLWQDSMSSAIANFFSARGYHISEAGPGRNTENFDKLITADCGLSDPKQTTGAFKTALHVYTMNLTMQFYDENGTRNCGRRTYVQSISTSASDDKDRIIRQGFTALLKQLQEEDAFPFYATQ